MKQITIKGFAHCRPANEFQERINQIDQQISQYTAIECDEVQA